MTGSPALTALIVLAVCFTIGVMARGVGETYAVFLLPLGAEFGWDRASLTGVYSTYMLVYGLGAPLAGYIFDRFGPRAVFGIGFACMGGGYFAAAHLQHLWQFYLCVGVRGIFSIRLREGRLRLRRPVFDGRRFASIVWNSSKLSDLYSFSGSRWA